VELIAVVDTAELARSLWALERFYMNNLVDEETRRCGEYLERARRRNPRFLLGMTETCCCFVFILAK
jgi:hypothetical protein